MESRAFIKHALIAIKNIQDNALSESFGGNLSLGGPDGRARLQKELNQLFSALQNPTLPTAYRLRDIALSNGFTVENKVQQRLAQFENIN